MSIWHDCKLGNVVTLKRGYDLPQQKRIDGIIPIYSSSGISGYHNKAMVFAPGVITGRYGTIGQVFYSEEDYWPLNTTLYVEDFHGNDPLFIYYFLKTIQWGKYQSASAVPGINRNSVHSEVVSIPDINTQCQIAGILHLHDKKISINDRINDNLLQQLQAIYQMIFGRPSQDDEPEGHLSDICIYSQRRIAVSSLSPESYYSTENMLPGKAGAIAASSLPTIVQTTGCMPGDVLISNIRPYFKKIVYCQSECGCSTDVLCFVPKTRDLSLYLYGTLYDDHFFDYMVAGSKGTKMPRGDKQQIMAYPIVLPSLAQLADFNAAAQPILAKIENGSQENKRLSSMRDILLPKLMSGEIDVSSVTF